MKKLVLVLSLALSLFLVACDKEKALEKLDVTVVSESYLYDQLDVDVVITLEDLEEAELVEISNAIASQIYMKYSNDIHDTKVTFTINLYGSDIAFSESNIDYGVVTYVINESFDKPGLQPGIFQK